MIRHKCLAVLAIATMSVLPTVHAESLIVENIDKPSTVLTARPARGMSMDTVEAKWGQPTVKRSAIGEPPISRWEYSAFVVYFEYRNVIHAVQKH